MQVGHLVGLGDGGEVHDLVLLQQQTAVLSQPGRGPGGERQAQGGQAGGNTRFHAHTPSPASRAGTPCTRPITRITPQAAASRAMQALEQAHSGRRNCQTAITASPAAPGQTSRGGQPRR